MQEKIQKDLNSKTLTFALQGRIQPGGTGARAPPPPAVTPSMGIYILFYNALIK